MSIEYVEILDTDRNLVGIIDDFISVIWHTVYFGVGDFEIYARATPKHIELLSQTNHVTRPNTDEVGIIEKIEVTTSAQDGDVIIATGRFAKSILDRRLIYNLSGNTNRPTVLKGKIEENVRKAVKDNAIACGFDSNRNIPILALGTSHNLSSIIVDDNGNAAEKQVSYQNLLSYTDSLLQEYGYGAKVVLNDDTKMLEYEVYEGVDRSIDNSKGNSVVVFSQDYDNLIQGDYTNNTSEERNVALIGGEGEGIDRFYSLYGGAKKGLARRELFVNASSLNKTLAADELQQLFPTGNFVGTYFVVSGSNYAKLVVDVTAEYSLKTLQDKFPTGTVDGTKFKVGSVVYATQIYGEDDRYNPTPIGYKAILDVDGTIGNYTLADVIYTSMLNTAGTQELSLLNVTLVYKGTINVTFGNWILNRDYFLGDVVTIQDNRLGLSINVRITEVTEVQDENGYSVDAVYE